MIWFGTLAPGITIPPPQQLRGTARDRMQRALEAVAAAAPHLSGSDLVDALARTGWVDATTATALLPEFRHFDADRYFAEHLRRLSFRGTAVAEEFRSGIERALRDVAGEAQREEIGPDEAIRFRHGEREGVVLAYPEVAFSLGGRAREAVAAAAAEMPDALVLVARNFDAGAAGQLRAVLERAEVPGTLLTLNLLLGLRATALRYQPPRERVLDLLASGRPVRSVDLARLVDR